MLVEIQIDNLHTSDPTANFVEIDISDAIADYDACDLEHMDLVQIARDLYHAERETQDQILFDMAFD